MVILNRNETFLSSSSLPLGEGLGVARKQRGTPGECLNLVWNDYIEDFLA